MSLDWKVWQRPEVVARFTARRRDGIPGGDLQIETMLRLIATTGKDDPSVLDLGCGDGVLLEAIRSVWPDTKGIALDGSPAMLEKARPRLAGADVQFVEADFNDPAWTERLPARRFDAIVSGFAIHHSEDPAKQRIYRQVFGLLAPGGVFVNIEHVASASPLGEALWEDAFCEHAAQAAGRDVEAVRAEFEARPDRDANRLAPVERQLAWLRAIGFVDVDCYWKHFELAALAGRRPKS